MPTVSFYITSHRSGMQALQFACEIVEKAYHRQQSVYIHTNSKEDAERMDRLLWTYADDSFLPHQLVPGEEVVLIGFEDQPTHPFDVLVNLSSTVPPFFSHCQEVIEIVFTDPVVQQLARERYKFYRDQGLPITTHK